MMTDRAPLGVYREDNSLLVGAATFSDDLRLEGETSAIFVRSPHAHAEILRLDGSAARRMSGVVAVFTAEDLGAAGPLSDGSSPFRPAACDAPSMSPLAHERVRYVGEPLALVIAESRLAGLDAAEAVAAEYLPVEVVVDAATAAERAGNIVAAFSLGDPKRTAAALAQAPRIVSINAKSPRIAGMPMEPRAAAATWTEKDEFTLYAPLQAPHLARDILASVLGVQAQAIRVLVPRMGGGFGVRLLPTREDAALLLAARKTGRPVRWCADRSEGSFVDPQARDHAATLTGGFDLDGHLLALRVDGLVNVGAYPGYFTIPISTTTGNRIVDGPYVIPTLDLMVRCVVTNTVPIGPYRGAGRPEVIHRLERLMDTAALELGLDPVAIRRRNLIPGAAMPFRNNAGQLYDSGDYPTVLDAALKISDWDGFPGRRCASERFGRLRGRGLCCHIDTTSGVAPSETVVVRLARDGRIEVLSGTQEMGQSLASTYRRLVVEATGIPLGRVDIVQGDTSRVRSGVGSYGSRSLIIGGSALCGAAAAFAEKLKDAAGDVLEARVEDVTFDDDGARVVGTDRLARWEDLALARNIEAEHEFASTFAFPNGCYVCEVEIDKETGAISVERFTAVDDVGRVINAPAVHGQVEGGVMQGIGQALMERCVYDDSGQLLNASFLDYAMPRALDLPIRFDGVAMEAWPSPLNPQGAKGAGESGAVGTPPAIVAAVVDALRPFGVKDLTMPIRAETVWRAMQAGAPDFS